MQAKGDFDWRKFCVKFVEMGNNLKYLLSLVQRYRRTEIHTDTNKAKKTICHKVFYIVKLAYPFFIFSLLLFFRNTLFLYARWNHF